MIFPVVDGIFKYKYAFMEIHAGERHLINIKTISINVVLRHFFLSYVFITACTLPVALACIFLLYVHSPAGKKYEQLQLKAKSNTRSLSVFEFIINNPTQYSQIHADSFEHVIHLNALNFNICTNLELHIQLLKNTLILLS